MIKLDTHEYCQDCVDFEPIVIQRPERFNVSFGDFRYCGDTIVECEYRRRCEAIHSYLKKEDNKND